MQTKKTFIAIDKTTLNNLKGGNSNLKQGEWTWNSSQQIWIWVKSSSNLSTAIYVGKQS